MSNDAMREAAIALVREALDTVSVHPCDFHDDAVRAASLTGNMRCLYDALAAPAQSEAKPVAWLSSFIHRHPDPDWRRIYTAHTSEKRARDYVSDLIDPKVEPLYTAPSAAPAVDSGDALEFTPDAHNTVADMANVGHALMQAIKRHNPQYHWNECPSEIVRDLMEARDEALATRHAPTGADALEGWKFKKIGDEQYWAVLTPEGCFALARDADDERSSSRILAQLAAVLAKRGGA